jgi:hypothetical protein
MNYEERIEKGQKANEAIKAAGIKVRTFKDLACSSGFWTEVSGDTFKIRNVMKALNAAWMPGSKVWMMRPNQFDVFKVAEAIR